MTIHVYSLSAPERLPAVPILGLPVHDLTMEQALHAVDGFVQMGTPHHIITADASMLVMAQDDPELHAIIRNADLITPDSAGVLWAARQKGESLRERVSGVEIVERLCARSARHQYRLFFFGAAPGVAQQAAERMQAKYPGAQVVGARSGFFQPDEVDAIVSEIRATRADIVCVALGIPKQEKWITAHRDRLGASVLIGVGGTFDVLSGNTRRAPGIMQKLQLEWLWRLLSNPKKISKVLLLPRFVRLVRQSKNKRS